MDDGGIEGVTGDKGKVKAEAGLMGRPAPQSGLKAGTTDDNANFDAWLTYVSEWGGRGDIDGWADRLDVTGRRYVQVLDVKGRPVPDARVSILDPSSERVVWAGRGYGDGRVPMYPKLKVPGRALDIAGDAPEGGWLVQAETPNGAVRTVRWDGRGEELDVTVDTKGLERGAPVPVDVCFIIDTTGSMGDEIDRIKTTLLSVTNTLREDASQGVDLRYGAVLYRDIGDVYVTRRHAFTTDIEGFDAALQTIKAGGGGDSPESLNQGIAVGVAGMEWREGAARVAFVIADAPPHMNYQEDVSYGRAATAAAHRGIRIHTVAASGLDDRGSYAFRQIAQLTRGQFIYIEYGSSAASAADHGVRTPTASNNLDDIVYGRIRAEIDGWGKDGTEKVARR
jgi:Mg-chelatase subunit ChlD